MRFRIAVASLLSLAFSSPAAGQERNASDYDDLRAFTARTLEQAHVRGASVALIRGGQVVWAESFGVKDDRSGEPVTLETVFEAASLGKVVAAYAALILVDGGRWSLSMPASSTRLDVEAGCEAPRLVDLLSHTAGLGNRLSAARYRGACHPPTGFSYAGQGYLVLQDLLEAQTGKAAELIMQELVFRPLGMTRSTYAEPKVGDRATGHADLVYGLLSGRAIGPLRPVGAAVALLAAAICLAINQRTRRRYSSGRAFVLIALEWLCALLLLVAWGAVTIVPVESLTSAELAEMERRVGPGSVSLPSSLHSSAEDLARFAQELLQPRLVREATRDLLFQPQVEVGAEIAWGSGMGIDRAGEPTTYWQWGSNPGFQSLLVIEPTQRDAIVVLTNTGGSLDLLTGRWGGYSAAKRIARRALGVNGRWDLHRAAQGDPTGESP